MSWGIVESLRSFGIPCICKANNQLQNRFATRAAVWFFSKIKVNFNFNFNFDFATRCALSGEFLFAARQKEPKALDRQR